MSAPAAAPSQPAETDAQPCVAAIDSTAPGWSRPLVERQLAVLGRLAEAGLNVALAIEGRATAAADEAAPAALDDIALAYDRVARAVRRTIALQSERIAHLEAPDAPPADRDEATAERKATVGHIVRRLANKQHRPEFTDRIGREARDWLDDENIYGDILAHPVSEIIDWICRDLGLSPDWVRLAQEAWAQEELQSGAVGYPLKGHKGLAPPTVARTASPTGKAANVRAASP
jgi:hypothetical protein